MMGYDTGTRYQETAVMTSSPERLIPLMYDHLLVNLKRGGLCIRSGDIEGKFKALGKASDIVTELIAALDFEQGGELATRLASLYGFWAREISISGRELDVDRLGRVTEMVDSLRDGWEEAVRQVETGDLPAAPIGSA